MKQKTALKQFDAPNQRCNMAKSIIVIEDKNLEEKTVTSEVNYEFSEEEKVADREITSATAYGYTIHYLFQTGIINHYVNDAMKHLSNVQEGN